MRDLMFNLVLACAICGLVAGAGNLELEEWTMKKFELTSETRVHLGTTLYRIKALISFRNVSAGDLGGFVEKEENLDQFGSAWVCGNARVSGDARVYGNAWVSDNARVGGNAWVYDNARVSGNAWVYDNARVGGNARVDKIGSVFWISAIGSRNDTSTFFKCNDGKIRVSCGCFFGDLEEFSAKVKETHGENEYGRVYMLAIEMAKARISLEGER